MRTRLLTVLSAAGLSASAAWPALAQTRGSAPPPAERINYLTFAQGAVPVSIGGAGARLGANFEHAVRIIDGEATAFQVVGGANAETDTEFVYRLPALTTFDRFAVPGIVEVPGPADTFTKRVEVHGSASSATAGFVLLAAADLETHRATGMVTEVPVVLKQPVRWIRLRLVGGINILRPQSNFQFSEIIGNGTQETPELARNFTGAWRTMGLRLRLRQEGSLVSGCYDRTGQLTGTVQGGTLRATGVNPSDGTRSAFILSVADDGSIRGVRSSNGAPFRLYSVAAAPNETAAECGQPPAPSLGCNAIVHGITFEYDSAEIKAESSAVLAELFKGLQSVSPNLVIEGHTSSEGSDEYNLRLSERRAHAVVADLVARGLSATRVRAAGLGESRPIAPNTDENGRSMNRRVEVKCQ